MLKRNSFSIDAYDISFVFIGLMFLLPFISMSHPLLTPAFYAEWIAVALGLLAILPLLRKISWQNLQIPQISLVFIGLAIIAGVQWMSGMLHSTQYALLVLSYFIWAFLLTILGSYLRQTLGWEKLVTVLAWCLVIAGVINIGIVVLQVVTRTGGFIPFLPNLASYGALSQPNHFANFIGMATASLIYLYTKGRFSPSFFALMLTCFLIMLSFSGSRSAWLYLGALTFFAAMMHFNIKKQATPSTEEHHLLRIGLFLLPAFVLVQLFVYFVLPDALVNLPTERMVEAATANSTSARLQIWYDSLRLFSQSPLLGTGVGTMRFESFLLLDAPSAMAFNRVFEHAHNLFLHILAEMGIFASLIVLTGLITWLRAFKWRTLSTETWWLISLLAVLGIHSMLEYPLWFSYFLGIFAILLGAGSEKTVMINLPKKITDQSHTISRLLATTGLAILLLLGSTVLASMLITNAKLESRTQQWMLSGSLQQEKEIDRTSRYSLLHPYTQLMSAMSMTINTNDISNKVLLSQSAMHFKPLRKIAYQHALLLELQGDHVNAAKQLKRSLIAYPRTPEEILSDVPSEYRALYRNLLNDVQQTH